jgi:hypothetical protein
MQTIDREISGYLDTTPLDIEHSTRLTVNAAELSARRSWVDAEVLDAGTGEVLSGFSRDECVPLDIDGVSVPVVWQGADLGACNRNHIGIRFHLHGGAKLHAYSLH